MKPTLDATRNKPGRSARGDRRPDPGGASPSRPGAPRVHENVITLALLALLAVIIVFKAWISDDAYITFRTIDNWFRGFGLRWNVVERVQVYTHPLWMFTVAAVRAVTGEVYYASLGLGIALSLATAVLFARRLAPTVAGACAGLTVLACSRAFTDYSTSGLENPLTHVLLALWLLVYFSERPSHARILLLFLIASLIAVNRIDALLLVLPGLVLACAGLPLSQIVRAGAIGIVPLALWEGFSVLYYGAPVPNSAYAKLGAGIGIGELVPQGFHYFANSVRWDPVTLAAIAFGTVMPLARRDRKAVAVSAGIALYCLYIVRIGGDFMSGRFFTAPLLATVVLIARLRPSARVVWPLCGLLLAVTLAVPSLSPFTYREKVPGEDPDWCIDTNGIANERLYYQRATSLLRAGSGTPWPDPETAELASMFRLHWREDGYALEFKRLGTIDAAEAWPPSPDDPSARPMVIRGAVGIFGYYLGPGVYLLDQHALGDPLLSRIPALRSDPALPIVFPKLAARRWRIGHHMRPIPAGYAESVGSEQNRIRDPDLRAYYDKIRLVTRGPVFDAARLRAVVSLNLGLYDGLRRKWISRQRNLNS